MFSSLAYAIVLMGCSDEMTMCREMAKDQRVFVTLRECENSQDKALLSEAALEIDYPVVATKCIERERRFAQTGTRYIGK